MSSWDMHWSSPTASSQSVIGCELARRGGLAHEVEVELSTTNSDARKTLWHAKGLQRAVAHGGTQEFETTLPGANLDDVADGPVKFDAPRNSDDSALTVTVSWSDTAGGPANSKPSRGGSRSLVTESSSADPRPDNLS